ncbi:MAG: hypothetical protein AAFO29_02035 [Actinomycetota bacterium]
MTEFRDGMIAVVEVGSGSVKLLIADGAGLGAGKPDVLRRSIKTRLWSGDGRSLAPDGLAATEAAFASFAAALADAGNPEVAVVGTAVTRTVGDLEPIDQLSKAAFGVPLEVLSGEREGALAHAGAVIGRDLPGPVSVIDIGSGSTELATDAGLDGRVGEGTIRTFSVPIGARVMTESYLHHDPPGPDELSSALSVAELHYDDIRREMAGIARALGEGTLLGVGAIGQIAAVEIGLDDPAASVDGYRLEKVAVEEVFRALATESAADRAFNPGLLPEHVDDIVGGLCVLVEFMRRFGLDEVIVSERDLRHGLAAELLATK